MYVLDCSDFSVLWHLGNSYSSAVSSFLQHSPHCPHWWYMLLNLTAHNPKKLGVSFWWENGSIASSKGRMELIGALLVFIPSEGEKASFPKAGKHQISLAKMVTCGFLEYPVLFFTYVPLWLFEVYPESPMPKQHIKSLACLLFECQLKRFSSCPEFYSEST